MPFVYGNRHTSPSTPHCFLTIRFLCTSTFVTLSRRFQKDDDFSCYHTRNCTFSSTPSSLPTRNSLKKPPIWRMRNEDDHGYINFKHNLNNIKKRCGFSSSSRTMSQLLHSPQSSSAWGASLLPFLAPPAAKHLLVPPQHHFLPVFILPFGESQTRSESTLLAIEPFASSLSPSYFWGLSAAIIISLTDYSSQAADLPFPSFFSEILWENQSCDDR